MSVELTNMVMVYNAHTSEVLLQQRVQDWKGITFPGGHLEQGESAMDSAVREVKEETGLNVRNLKYCGMIHWVNTDTFDRYIVFLYKTCDYDGELVGETREGKVFWGRLSDMSNMQLSANFINYLPVFFLDGISELFCPWNQNESWDGPDARFYFK